MNCSYCSVGSGSYLTYRRRSVAHVIKEIDYALSLGPAAFIDFEDENLALDNAWLLSLLDGIRPISRITRHERTVSAQFESKGHFRHAGCRI